MYLIIKLVFYFKFELKNNINLNICFLLINWFFSVFNCKKNQCVNLQNTIINDK